MRIAPAPKIKTNTWAKTWTEKNLPHITAPIRYTVKVNVCANCGAVVDGDDIMCRDCWNPLV